MSSDITNGDITGEYGGSTSTALVNNNKKREENIVNPIGIVAISHG